MLNLNKPIVAFAEAYGFKPCKLTQVGSECFLALIEIGENPIHPFDLKGECLFKHIYWKIQNVEKGPLFTVFRFQPGSYYASRIFNDKVEYLTVFGIISPHKAVYHNIDALFNAVETFNLT